MQPPADQTAPTEGNEQPDPTDHGRQQDRQDDRRPEKVPSRNSPRASTQATGTPTRTEIAVAASETSIDKRRAVDAPTPESASPSRLQGARTKRATTGGGRTPRRCTRGPRSRQGSRARIRSAAGRTEAERTRASPASGRPDPRSRGTPSPGPGTRFPPTTAQSGYVATTFTALGIAIPIASVSAAEATSGRVHRSRRRHRPT